MIILSIETSCDDTCISILKIHPVKSSLREVFTKGEQFNRVKKQKAKILSNIVSSQVEIHKKYGGVYPTMAKREHQRNLVPVLKKALEEAEMLENYKLQITKNKQITNYKLQTLKEILKREPGLFKNLKKFLEKYQKPEIDFIAVTIGPGLEPCLWTGVNFAKALAYLWNLKTIPVNHIEAHIFANFLSKIRESSKIQISKPKQITNYKLQIPKQMEFPAVCLVVSGGHTQLILMRDFGKYEILGETRDDAAGECFDKTARILGLGYPGGPAIAEQSRQWKLVETRSLSILQRAGLCNLKLPRPMIYSRDYDFSFSGLKTAVLYKVKNQKSIIHNLKSKQAMANEIQQAVIDVLIKKTIKSAKDYKAKTIMLGGGVAANEELRKQFISTINNQQSTINFLVPPKKFCTDNAAMLGITAFFHTKESNHWKDVKVNANLRIA